MKKLELLHQEIMVSPFTLGAIHRGFHNRLQYKYTQPLYFKNSVSIYKGVTSEWYGDGQNFADLGYTIISKAKKNVNFCYEVKKETFKAGEKLFQYNKKIESLDLTKLSNKELSQTLANVYHLANDICDLGVVSAAPDVGFSNFSTVLKEVIKKKIAASGIADKVNDYFNVLTNYGEGSLSTQENIELLKLALLISQDSELKNLFTRSKDFFNLHDQLNKNYKSLVAKIDAIRKKYHWLSFGHLGPEKKIENYLSDIKTILAEGRIKEKLNQGSKDFQQLKLKQKKYNKILKLNQEELTLFETARVFSYCKAYRYDIMLFTYYIFDKFLREISRRVGFGVNELRYLTLDEIKKILSGKLIFKRSEIKERQKLCVACIIPGGIKHLSGSQALAYIKKNIALPKVKKRIKVIHGTSAYLGRVIGPVKIVNSVTEMTKVNQGDVMVSIQTTPDLVPAMKKAAAFVTDIGGITSHAAIVAREMKKPCVIGTKVACRILKDGDMVEVNANEGDVMLLDK